MKLHILSDLHTEFADFVPPETDAEAVILAGDTRLDAEVAGVRCIGLNKVAMPGNLVALHVPARGRGYEILGEWPRREQLAS